MPLHKRTMFPTQLTPNGNNNYFNISSPQIFDPTQLSTLPENDLYSYFIEDMESIRQKLPQLSTCTGLNSDSKRACPDPNPQPESASLFGKSIVADIIK